MKRRLGLFAIDVSLLSGNSYRLRFAASLGAKE